MTIDKKFIDQFIDVTSKAALASTYLVGKKDKIAADKAAVDSMRKELNKINIKGKIVIGEGELDEAPMLYIGEILGAGNGGFLFLLAKSDDQKNIIKKLNQYTRINFKLDLDGTQVIYN